MKKRFLAALLSIGIIFTAVPSAPVCAADKPLNGGEAVLIVELSSPAVLEAEEAKTMGAQSYNNTAEAKNAQKKAKEEQAEVFERIKKICPSAKRRFSYTHTMNGFSVEAHTDDIDAVKAIDGVKNVTVSETIEAVVKPSDDEQASLFGAGESTAVNPCCEEIGADYMHENGYRGQGCVVAVIDSEFDTSHDMFQGEITNPRYSKADIKKIIDENELNADVTASGVYRNTKIPFAYNYAMQSTDVYKHELWASHGTHVAGIAAGNNGKNPDGSAFESVAPEAQLILMCISNEDGSIGSNDIICAAIDDAAKMGIDAINLSLGTAGKYFKTTEECVNRAANAGIIVSVSAGNEGRGYDYRNPWKPENIDYGNLGSPNFAGYSTSVASIETNKVWDTRYTLNSGEGIDIGIKIGRLKTLIYDRLELGKSYEYVYCGNGSMEDFENAGDLTDKIALIQRRDLTFAETSANAQNKNAFAVIYINRTTDEFKDLTFSDKITIPMCFVKNEDGEKLKSAETKTVSLIKEEGWFDNNTKGMPTYSSWAVDNNLNLKPEITAPGGKIYSSIYGDNYETYSGTSMSTPHITGAAALMYQYIDANYSEEQYKDIGKRAFAENLMMSAASIYYIDEESNIAASPRQQGAGLINLENAVKTPVYLVGNPGEDGSEGTDYGKSKISVKEIGSDNRFTLKFKAVNFTDNPVTYNNISVLCQTDSVDADGNIGDTIPFKFTASGVPETVAAAANSSEEISIEIELDDEAVKENMKTFVNGFWIDGFVILRSDDENVPEISIPYTGFCGDWTAAPIFDKPYYSGDSAIGDTALYSDSYSAGKRILGTNFIAEEIFEGEELKKYCSEKYAGISPNGDGECDDLLLYCTPLRRIDCVSFAVKNDDVEIFSAIAIPLEKITNIW